MQLSLLSFANRSADNSPEEYDLLIRAARFADEHDFTAVWVPERHFHPFGGGHPNPALTAAALAAVTRRIRLRAGSVVLPLHDPLRVAEDWAFVDNLSGGRVDIALATGWNVNDFVLQPDRYATRRRFTLDTIATLRELWAGKPVSRVNGAGEEVSVRTYPRPVQDGIDFWFTCASSRKSFADAGAQGLNVLTALLFQSVDSIADNIRLYRQTAERHGHDPDRLRVTLMVHTHVGQTDDEVRERVRPAFLEYLRSSVDLWKGNWPQFDRLDREADRERLISYAFERYFQTAALFGSVDKCLALARRFEAAGVDEIAALIDFGVAPEAIMDSLPWLDRLRLAMNTPAAPA